MASPKWPTSSGWRERIFGSVLPAYRRRWQRTWREVMPRGDMLPEAVWLQRHVMITRFALVQSLGLGVVAFIVDRSPIDVAVAVLVPGVPALAGLSQGLGRKPRTMSAVASLMLASATLVGLYGGMTEAHFHFFVMVGVASLYQDWAAFGVCVTMTILHHAVMGVGSPASVFATAQQQRNPIPWAVVHGGFILAASVTHMIAWKLNEQQEFRDPLTRLPNRTSFNLELDRMIALPGPVSVLFIDIDRFKAINDSNGHHIGDTALVHVAQAMRDAVLPGDVVARLGGDEFAILLRCESDAATEVAALVAAAVRRPLFVNGREVVITASIGTVDVELAGRRDGDQLMHAADLAMYAAKRAGRDRVMTYSAEMEEFDAHRTRVADALGRAVEAGELEVFYQPIVDAEVGRLCGVEALLRWDHPELGRIAPSEFIPIAEETGEILAMGAWTLAQACCRVAEWQRTLPGCDGLALAVNLSAQQLRDPQLLTYVGAALDESGLSPLDLTLEVTETSMLNDLDLACRQLEAVRALGVSVAIDDFGTGYSSLSYLARLPADKVKIDRSFVSEMAEQTNARALVQCILDMARALGLDVQAEGVEEVVEENLLRDMGCRFWQGYLFSPPVAASEMPALLARARPVRIPQLIEEPAW